MEPLLEDKDIVMIDRAQNSPQHKIPLAFRLENELYIKLCQRDGAGNLTMISVNKSYPDIIINKDNPPTDFEILGAIVWQAHSWI